jgi:hypothetical protein
LMVTMSQKSSFLQPANSVSQVLIPDSAVIGRCSRRGQVSNWSFHHHPPHSRVIFGASQK